MAHFLSQYAEISLDLSIDRAYVDIVEAQPRIAAFFPYYPSRRRDASHPDSPFRLESAPNEGWVEQAAPPRIATSARESYCSKVRFAALAMPANFSMSASMVRRNASPKPPPGVTAMALSLS